MNLFNVDVFGQAMLNDPATRVQTLRVDLGSTPTRAEVEKALHTWAGQLPVWLTYFGVAGLSATK